MRLFRRTWPWWIVAGLALAALALWFTQRAREVEVVTVSRGPVVQSIVATGRIDTPARIAISSQVAARIDAVTVREGDTVRRGQALVKLRSDEALAVLESARATLREAEGRQRQLELVQRPVAEQQLAQARANLDAARRELERARDLVAQGYVSQSRVDEAQRQLDGANAALGVASAQADGLRAGGIEAELARARIAQARANLSSAEARLDTLVLTAPADAVVLTREAEPGDTAQIGRTLMALAQAGATRIIATIDERNLRWMSVGQKATAVADAFPGQVFEAVVSRIAPGIDLQRGTVEVWLDVNAPPVFLKPDMTVSVETVVAQRDAALYLPTWAIREVDGPGARAGEAASGSTGGARANVLVMRDGRAEARAVSLGVRGVGVIEILDGLAEGEPVITPESGAVAGERVRLPGPRAKLSAGAIGAR